MSLYCAEKKLLVIFLFVFFTSYLHAEQKKIAVLGTGYVGLVIGAGIAELGHQVVCADIIEDKISCLQRGEIPIYEIDLEELVKNNIKAGRLQFSLNIPQTIRSAEIVFIAVGTPTHEDGSADLTFIEDAAKIIGQNTFDYKIVCVKSTVPVGTTRKIHSIVVDHLPTTGKVDTIFFPEFLREGSAVKDFFTTDRLVIGSESRSANNILKDIFKKLINKNIPVIETSFETAEAIKYASNAFLATKISFINEFANFCEATGADIFEVAKGIGLDKRIGPDFLKPGPGFGGSCLPKDTLSLLYQAKIRGVDLKIVQATYEANNAQQRRIVDKLEYMLNYDLGKKKIAILGLAYKANTDDIRSSPAIAIIKEILIKGGHITAYDPIAMNNMKKMIPEISYCSTLESALKDADAVIILTEWKEFKKLDLFYVKQLMKRPVIVDARNLFDPKELFRIGFQFQNVGRPLTKHLIPSSSL